MPAEKMALDGPEQVRTGRTGIGEPAELGEGLGVLRDAPGCAADGAARGMPAA